MFGEPPHSRHQLREVVIDLALDDRGRVSLRRLQITAIRRAADFDKAFGRTTNSADFRTLGGTGAFSGSFLTQRTGHRVNRAILLASSVLEPSDIAQTGVILATVYPGVLPFAGLWVSTKGDTVVENPNRLTGV